MDLVHGFLSVLTTMQTLLMFRKPGGRLPTCPDFPGTVLVYTCYLGVIINSAPFHSVSGLEEDLYGHPTHRPFLPQSLLSFHCWKHSSNPNEVRFHIRKILLIMQVKQKRL